MSMTGGKNPDTVMVSLGTKAITDRINETLESLGIRIAVRTKVLDVPVGGSVIDLWSDGSIRRTVVPTIKKILESVREEDGICTIALYRIDGNRLFGETSLMWSTSVMETEIIPDENVKAMNNTAGRVFISDYSVRNLKDFDMLETDTKEALNALGYEEVVRKNSEKPYPRGLVDNRTPFIIWADGNGNLLLIHRKAPMVSLEEIALGEKGIGARALKTGFAVWTDFFRKSWCIPGTKGPEAAEFRNAMKDSMEMSESEWNGRLSRVLRTS